MPYSGDFRPYFTIHDSDFRNYVNKAKPPANVILGVTNPFFVKALEHWPHTLRVGVDTRYVPPARVLAETPRFLTRWPAAARWCARRQVPLGGQKGPLQLGVRRGACQGRAVAVA